MGIICQRFQYNFRDHDNVRQILLSIPEPNEKLQYVSRETVAIKTEATGHLRVENAVVDIKFSELAQEKKMQVSNEGFVHALEGKAIEIIQSETKV